MLLLLLGLAFGDRGLVVRSHEFLQSAGSLPGAGSILLELRVMGGAELAPKAHHLIIELLL